MFIPFIFYFLFCTGFGWRNRARITSVSKRMNSHANGNGNRNINRKWVYKYLDWYQWELRDQNLIQIHFPDATATYQMYSIHICISNIRIMQWCFIRVVFLALTAAVTIRRSPISSAGTGKMWQKKCWMTQYTMCGRDWGESLKFHFCYDCCVQIASSIPIHGVAVRTHQQQNTAHTENKHNEKKTSTRNELLSSSTRASHGGWKWETKASTTPHQRT